MYGGLRGRLPAKLMALIKIRDYTCENAVSRVAAVQMMRLVNSGFVSDIHGLVTVQIREEYPEFTIVEVGIILGMSVAPLNPKGERRRLVNSRIDLRTFNEVYWGIGYRGYGAGVSILARLCHDAKYRLANSGEQGTIRQMEFCRRKHIIVKLYMYIEAIV